LYSENDGERQPTSTGRRGHVTVARAWLADSALSDSALRLMLWLDSHSDQYLSDLNVKRIAREVGWSRDRVKRTLADLDGLGLVSTAQIEHQAGSRTLVTLHLEAWGEGGLPRATRGAHDEAQGGAHGKAPSSSKHKPRNQLEESVVTDAHRLAEAFADGLVLYGGHGTKRPTVTDAWITEMDRLIRLDERDPEEVTKVVRWLFTSTDETATFWAAVTRSPAKLRKNWDTMAAQVRRNRAGKSAPGMDAVRRRASDLGNTRANLELINGAKR
jgi:hypothetical protein